MKKYEKPTLRIVKAEGLVLDKTAPKPSYGCSCGGQ